MDKPSSERRAIANRVVHAFSANAYEQVVTVTVQLVGIPILVHAWGARILGEWLVLVAVASYCSFASLGLAQSASNEMTAKVAGGDHGAAAAIYKRISRLLWGIALFGIVVAALAMLVVPLQRWAVFPGYSDWTGRAVLFFLMAEALLSQPNGMTHAGFRASGFEARHVATTSTVRLAQNIALWVAAATGLGPAVGAGLMAAIRLAATVAWAYHLSVRHTWLANLAQEQRGKINDLLHPAIANLAFPLGVSINMQGMVLVIGAILGPVSVVGFSAARTLTRVAAQAVTAVANSVEPEFARAHGRSNVPLLKSLYAKSWAIALLLASAASLALLLIGPHVFSFWTRGKIALDSATFTLLIASAFCSVLWYVSFAFLKAANVHLHASIVLVIGSLGATGAAYLALILGSSLWVCAALLLMLDLALSCYMVRTISRTAGICARDFWNAVVAMQQIGRTWLGARKSRQTASSS